MNDKNIVEVTDSKLMVTDIEIQDILMRINHRLSYTNLLLMAIFLYYILHK
jgi:hypothetical protein